MNLIENEKVIMKNATGEMTLTNFRLIKNTTKGGVTHYSSLFLGKVSSVQFRSHDYKWMLYGSIFFVVASVIAAFLSEEFNGSSIFLGVILGLCLLVPYFLTRTQILEICGEGSERIVTQTKEGFESAFKFIFTLEHMLKTGNPPVISGKVSESKSA